jgi:hypothetical protein
MQKVMFELPALYKKPGGSQNDTRLKMAFPSTLRSMVFIDVMGNLTTINENHGGDHFVLRGGGVLSSAIGWGRRSIKSSR